MSNKSDEDLELDGLDPAEEAADLQLAEERVVLDHGVVAECEHDVCIELKAITLLEPQRQRVAIFKSCGVRALLADRGFQRALMVTDKQTLIHGCAEYAAAELLGLSKVPVQIATEVDSDDEAAVLAAAMEPDPLMVGEVAVLCVFGELQKTESLKPNKNNPNRHSDEQIAILAEMIRQDGFRNPVVVSDRSGQIVKGEGRWLAAKKLGMSHVPVDVQHFRSAHEELAALIADNEIATKSRRAKKRMKRLAEAAEIGKNPELFGMNRAEALDLSAEEKAKEKKKGKAESGGLCLPLYCRDEEQLAELRDKMVALVQRMEKKTRKQGLTIPDAILWLVGGAK